MVVEMAVCNLRMCLTVRSFLIPAYQIPLLCHAPLTSYLMMYLSVFVCNAQSLMLPESHADTWSGLYCLGVSTKTMPRFKKR